MATQEQIEAFHQFASDQIRKGADSLSMSDLFDLWEVQDLSPGEHAENVAAIQASIDDMRRGVTGRDASEVLREMRRQSSQSSGQ